MLVRIKTGLRGRGSTGNPAGAIACAQRGPSGSTGSDAGVGVRTGAGLRTFQLPSGFVLPEPERIVGVVVLHERG